MKKRLIKKLETNYKQVKQSERSRSHLCQNKSITSESIRLLVMRLDEIIRPDYPAITLQEM